MVTEMSEHDLTSCITTKDLANLFDEAFAKWREGSADGDPRRQTPRIPVEGVRPLFVASFTAQDVPLNCPAIITDVSADGLGIILPEPVPVGATLNIAFEKEGGGHDLGMAVVVFSSRREEGGYTVGLCFNDNIKALDAPEAKSTPRWFAYKRLKEAGSALYETITNRRSSIHSVERTVNGIRAELRVEAKLFRYTAALWVKGRKVAGRSGVLRDRFRNLFGDLGLPTVVALSGGGWSASALLYPRAVGGCGIEPPVRLPDIRFSGDDGFRLRAS